MTAELSDEFRRFELDLQETKVAYLYWALSHIREPPNEYRHLFVWEHQDNFCIVNSKYGRAFSISPFGAGVRGVPRSLLWGRRAMIDEYDTVLKERLNTGTTAIRNAIRLALDHGDIQQARDAVLNFYWLKLGQHELLFDRVQYRRDDTGKLIRGRWGMDESEGWHSLTGIRNRIINVVRYGEDLEDDYTLRLNTELPGLSKGRMNRFLNGAMTWNRYAMCAFDCGPVLWGRSGFVDFNSMVRPYMNKVGWPYKSTAYKILNRFYHIALDYRRPPIRILSEPDTGYALISMRERFYELYDLLDEVSEDIQGARCRIR